MAWIKTVPFKKADKKLREALSGQRAFYPAEYATPTSENEESIITTHPYPGCVVSCILDIRSVDVAGASAIKAGSRDDRDGRFNKKRLPLLTACARRVTA
jgi:hypothetical protein